MNNNYIDVNATPSQGNNPNPAQQGAPYQMPPQAPPPPPPAPEKRVSYWAIISLIAGLLNFKFPPFGAIAALITGYVAKNEIKKSNETIEGNGLATAGIVLGWVGIVFSLIVLTLVILTFIGIISGTPIICGSFINWLNTQNFMP